MTGALSNSAIDNCVFVGTDAALIEIDFCQFGRWLERGIIVRGGLPRHALCPGNMTAAQHTFLRILWHVRDLTSIFPRRTHIDQRLISLALSKRFIKERADLLVEAFFWHPIICLRVFWSLTRYLASFCFPLVASAVENFYFLMAEQPEGPKRIARPPVGLVAIENTSGVRRYPVTAAKPRKFFRRNIITN